MHTFSDDNDNVNGIYFYDDRKFLICFLKFQDNDHSDFSGDENFSASDDEYDPEDINADEEKPTKRSRNKITIPEDKELVPVLLEAYKNMPQLWDLSHPEKCTSQRKKEECFKTIAENLNSQLKQKLTSEIVKKKINNLRRDYEKEIERKLHGEESNDNENTELWYMEQMEFLRGTVENKLKLRVRKH